MRLSRRGLVVSCMVLFLVLLPKVSLGRQSQFFGLIDSFLPKSPDIDEDKVEKMLLDCGLHLKDIQENIKNVDFSILRGMAKDFSQIYVKIGSVTKDSKVKTVAPLSPHLEHYFLECLSKQNLSVHDLAEGNDLRNWYSCYLVPLLGWCPSLRRHLADQLSETALPAPTPAPAPAPASVISHAHALAPSPDLGSGPPMYGPTPSSIPEPESSLTPIAFPPNQMSSNTNPTLQPKKQENNNKTIVFAVVLSIAGTSFVLGLLFLLYNKCCKNKGYSSDSLRDDRDDRPFPNLSPREFTGSSQKPFGIEVLSEKNKLGTLSHRGEPMQVGNGSSLNVSSADAPPYKLYSGLTNSSIGLSSVPTNGLAEKPTPPPPPPPPPPVIAPVSKAAPPAPVPPPSPASKKAGTPPPPPPEASLPRPSQSNPSSSRVPRPSPLGPKQSENAVASKEPNSNGMNTPKAKLKPFFWDKVPANPDQSMVWNKIKSGSFQFDEEKIESLFGYTSANKSKNDGKESSSKGAQYIRILDAKKSQNLAISLKALNVTIEEVCDALMEGNELPVELLQTLLKMAPTSDEELRLRLYTGDLSELGPAERFLKTLLDIPFVFQRLDVLFFMYSLSEEVSTAKESFLTLEVACAELKDSRLFLKLLEAVLKTGNRMNDGTFRGGAQAFKLDTLLKLADVKGADGKTTLLHFVVQEIIRSEGVRTVRMARERSGRISHANPDDFTDDSLHESEDYYRKLGLKVVSGLGDELQNVKKAACLDADALTILVANLGQRLVKTKEFLNTSMKSLEEESEFHQSLKCFVEQAETQITFLLEEEKRIRSLVKKTRDFFHGNASKDEGLQLFVIVRDFLVILDKVCKEVRESPWKVKQASRNREIASSPVPDQQQLIFPAIRGQQVYSSSSDDES